MKEKEFIVAIELGSSAIRGIAGRRQPDDSVQVERIVQVTASDCIHRGVVYNIEKTTNAIRQIREALERDLQLQVVKAYVGVQGQSVRTIKNFVREVFDTEREVTDADVDNLLDRNFSTNYGDLQILEVVPQEYKLDHKEDDDPQGVETRTIEGRFNNIVARAKVYENFKKCVENAGLRVAGVIIAPLALANRVLSEQERRSGCALVDMGAQTTTVQVYKGGKLRYLATLPLGGNSLTHDLMTCRDIEFHEAETLKLSHGVAVCNLEKEPSAAELPITGDRTFPLSMIERVCEARMEEILGNVWQCIQRSEISAQLTSGVLLTGGAARITDMTRACTEFMNGMQKVHMARPLISSNDLMRCGSGLQGGNFDTLVALLAHGEEVCTQPIPEVKVEEPQELFPENEPTPVAAEEQPEYGKQPAADGPEIDDEPKEKKESLVDKGKRFWQRIVDSLNE